jgi:hypothetical protein
MPRDIAIVTPIPLTPALWEMAGNAASSGKQCQFGTDLGLAGSQLQLADLGSGALQLTAEGGDLLLTVSPSLRSDCLDGVALLVPQVRALVGSPLWWTEAWAPWGRSGFPGVAIAKALAAAVGGYAMAADDADLS